MKAVVLAAGEGVRLQPITSTRPKHLIKIVGKPVLENCLDALKASGINDVLIVVHFMADSIRQYFGDGAKLGLKIEYAEQEAVLGTGNAVGVAESFVDSDFMLIYGDLLFTTTAVKKVIELHLKDKPNATMAIVPVRKPEDYGIVQLGNEKEIKRIIEKPSSQEAPSNLANAGVYIFSTEIFEKAKLVSASSRGEREITDAIALLLQGGGKVLAAKLSHEDWFDIGKPWDLIEANRWALTRMNHKVSGTVESGAYFTGPVTIADTARIRSGAYIEGPAFFDEESDIGPNCYIRPCTTVGRGVRIGNACEVKNSVIMDGAHIGHLSYIGDSVIGEKCNLGAGTVTANYRFDAKTVMMMVKDKIVSTERKKLGAVLGDNVKTGINANLMPGVKIGINSWVGPNVVVDRDLPSNTVMLLRQNVEKRELKP